MNVIKQVGNITLNQGNLMASGLFNLFNKETNQVSYWFADDTKDELVNMNDNDFIIEAEAQFEIASHDDKIYQC